MMKELHEDLQEINKVFKIIAIKMIVFTVILSAMIIGMTFNVYRQFQEFNRELDIKYERINAEFAEINAKISAENTEIQ